MTFTSETLRRSRPWDLFERDALVGSGLGREAEDAFAEDVSLDLVGAAADGDRRRGEEQREPLVLADQPTKTLDGEGEVGQTFDGGRATQLGTRSLRPRRAADLHGGARPQVRETTDLELRHDGSSALAHEWII